MIWSVGIGSSLLWMYSAVAAFAFGSKALAVDDTSARPRHEGPELVLSQVGESRPPDRRDPRRLVRRTVGRSEIGLLEQPRVESGRLDDGLAYVLVEIAPHERARSLGPAHLSGGRRRRR